MSSNLLKTDIQSSQRLLPIRTTKQSSKYALFPDDSDLTDEASNSFKTLIIFETKDKRLPKDLARNGKIMSSE